jgi:hypothetical protein
MSPIRATRTRGTDLLGAVDQDERGTAAGLLERDGGPVL